jgi:hypothetical protein
MRDAGRTRTTGERDRTGLTLSTGACLRDAPGAHAFLPPCPRESGERPGRLVGRAARTARKEKAEGEPGVEAAAPAAALRWRTPFPLGLAAAALAAAEAVSGTSNGGVSVLGREVQARGARDPRRALSACATLLPTLFPGAAAGSHIARRPPFSSRGVSSAEDRHLTSHCRAGRGVCLAASAAAPTRREWKRIDDHPLVPQWRRPRG